VSIPHSPARTFDESSVATVPEVLGLDEPHPVVVVIGGAGNLDHPDKGDLRGRIEELFRDALRPAIAQTGAIVVTGGTDAGVMRMAGDVLADVSRALVGVVPSAKVAPPSPEAALNESHTAFVLTSGTRWGSETEVLFNLAERFTRGVAPGIVVLANGGKISIAETNRFLRGGWPILPLTSTEGAAKDLLDAIGGAGSPSTWAELHRADVEELGSDIAQARRQLVWRLHSDELLKAAWSAFASYDAKADDLKRTAMRSGRWLRGLSITLLLAITLVVQFAVWGWTTADGALGPGLTDPLWSAVLSWVRVILQWVAVALPLGIALAAALGGFIGAQGKWRTVRSSAETMKREIYRYRARAELERVGFAGGGEDERTRLGDDAPTDPLAAVLRVVGEEGMRAEIGLAETQLGLVRGRPSNVDLDELEDLTARIYLKRRVEPQLIWYGETARRHRGREWRVVIAGAIAAGIAAVLVNTPFAPWVTLLILAATVFAFTRERGMTRHQHAGFDRAVSEVNTARTRWLTLPPAERSKPATLVEFVDAVEDAFESEGLSWSDVMRRAAQGNGTQSLGFAS
jgi:hypothetical protein